MNIVLFDSDDYINDTDIILRDHRFTHIQSVLKKNHNDTIKVGKREGKMGTATVIAQTPESITLRPSCTEEPPKPLPAILVVALPRPQSMRKVVHTATVMGVKEIYFIKTWKVDKNYWSTPSLLDERIDERILEALMQCCDTISPKVHLRKAFKKFAEDELPSIIEGREARLFHPDETPTPFTIDNDTSYVYIIGPEGGFNQYEVDLIESVGAVPTSLGSRIQRVEQAVGSILGYTALSLL